MIKINDQWDSRYFFKRINPHNSHTKFLEKKKKNLIFL